MGLGLVALVVLQLVRARHPHVPPGLELLLAAGSARAVRLDTGLTVWVVEPGAPLLGVQVVEGDISV